MRDKTDIRKRVVCVLEAAQKDISPVDLLENLAGQGFQHADIRAVVTAMLAESIIDMTSTRKLRLSTELVKQGPKAKTKTELKEPSQGMAAGAGA